MTKYSFVIFHREAEDFLKNLQNIGVVDVTRQNRAIDTVSKDKFEEIALYNSTVRTLKSIRSEAESKKLAIPEYTGNASAAEIVADVNSSVQRRDFLKGEIRNLSDRIVEAAPWGAFTAADFEKIKALGLIPHFYCVSCKRFSEAWKEEYALHIIDRNESKVHFVILQEEGAPYAFKEQECNIPDVCADELQKEHDAYAAEAEALNARLLSYTHCMEAIMEAKEELFSNLDIYLASSGSRKEAEDTIVIFEAFAPTDICGEVDRFLEDNNVYYMKDDAKVEDNPPIKLKNNFFAKLYEPIGDLYMLPKYGELDLTVFFAPFYMLFFGLCLGDMGYGLVLIIAGLIVNFKVPAFANYGKLVSWLGLGAVIMPALGGTFFGAKIYDLLPMPQSITDLFFSDMKMFWFAIIFGLFQIVFARLLNAFYRMKTIGITAGLSNIGWSICITWAAVFYASLEMEFELPSYVAYIGYVGLALIILFSDNSRNPIVRILKGTYSLYDATGVFGDMLSYIRLFGLGTAGSILGLVVNSVAMQMSGIPYVGWFFTILMLLVGHTAVLFLSALGAFVHPMRLTFVEFYKNAGFEGGGRPYSPLAKNKK